jgi:hypothetical protein
MVIGQLVIGQMVIGQLTLHPLCRVSQLPCFPSSDMSVKVESERKIHIQLIFLPQRSQKKERKVCLTPSFVNNNLIKLEMVFLLSLKYFSILMFHWLYSNVYFHPIDKGNQQLNFWLVGCKQIKACSIDIYLVFP